MPVCRTSSRLLFLLLIALLCLAGPTSLVAQEGDDTAPPVLPAVMVESPPVLDGVLDDACWREATHMEGFWRENVDAPELERTEAWICYDRKAIYAAFRCHDSRPSEIRADQTRRQGSMHHDDRVEIALDVQDAGLSDYEFRVNAAGAQQDEVPGGTSEKIEWRGDWRAAASRDEGGWSAEIEIPFSILRYPDGQTSFRFFLSRRLAREEDDSIWPPGYARVDNRDNCARLTGLVTPPVPFRYVLMPYLLSVVSEQEDDRETLTAGLDVKGTFPNGVVGLATYHPDFRNIEDVVETIDFTFVERYLPEYRPFFQEGSGYLPSTGDEWHWGPVELLYSRRIEKLDWGLKSFGRLGAHRFGILDAYRRGGENHLAWKYDHLFGTQGRLGFSGVQRRVPGEPDNFASGIGGHWSVPFVGGGRSYGADWYHSRTEGEGGDDQAIDVSASSWRREGLGWWASYSSVGAEFRADDGYVPETGVRGIHLGLDDHHSYDSGPLLSSGVAGSVEVGESEAGSRRSVWLDHSRSWRNGWRASASVSRGERDGLDVVSNGLGAGWNHQDMYRSGDARVAWGERYGYPYRYQSVSQTFRLREGLSAELRAERAYAAYYDDDGNLVPAEQARQVVLTTTYEISEERTVASRLVRQASHTNMYAAYRQRVRRGMDLLIVAGDPNAEEWVSRLAVKAIWCF